MRTIVACIVLAFAVIELTSLEPQISPAERDAITGTALDYIEGFYTGDAARMERSLSPELAKRIVRSDPAGKSRIDHMGAAELVDITRGRAGKPIPASGQQKDVTVLDVYGNAASVKVVANDWIDYLHLARVDGRWVIVNVLWEMKVRR